MISHAKIDYIGMGILVLIILVFASVAGSMIYALNEKSPLTYQYEDGRKAVPFLLPKEEYEGDDDITFDVPRCAEYTLSYNFSQQFRNIETGEIYVLASIQDIRVMEGCDVASSVPKKAHPDMGDGRYVLEGTANLKGKLRSFEIEYQTVPFKYTRGAEPIVNDDARQVIRLKPTPVPVPRPTTTPATIKVEGKATVEVKNNPTPTPMSASPTPTAQPSPNPMPSPTPNPTPTPEPTKRPILCGILKVC